MEWQDSYNVGVAALDDAHRKLFSIVKRLAEIMADNDKGKNRRACIEGIKYFKNYTLEHFRQEEEYMRAISYSGYPKHKRIHEELKNVTIPALEVELEQESYSDASVSHFIGTCLAWLTVHIMVEDQAITGKVASRVHHREQEEDAIVQMGNVISEVTEETFAFDAKLVDKYYSGGVLEHPVCFLLTYGSVTDVASAEEDAKVAEDAKAAESGMKRVLMAFEESFLFFAVGGMMGVRFAELNGIVINTMEQLIQANVQRVGMRMGEADYMRAAAACRIIGMEALEDIYREEPPRYSLLMETEKGRFSLAMD